MFVSYYRRRIENIERSKPGALKKSLAQIESLTAKPARQGKDAPNLAAQKPEFLTEATWVAAQRAKLFMWVIWFCLCAILTVLIAIHFLSYSETLREMFAMPDMSSYPSLQAGWHFVSDALTLNRAPLLLVLFGAWLPFLTIFGPSIQPPPVSVHRRLHLRWRHPLVVRWRGPRC